jgi:DNA-binding transcriptional LysR family regulator
MEPIGHGQARCHECFRQGRDPRQLRGGRPRAWVDAIRRQQGGDGAGATAWRPPPRPHDAARQHERCLEILAQVEETELQVSRLHDEPKGVLKINAPMSFGMLYLGDAVAAFMADYPDLRIELMLTDRFIDPVEEGVDVTIRIADLADSSLIARKLASTRRVVVASPAYIERHGAPKTPDDLARHRWLSYGATTTLQRWTYTRDDGAAASIPLTATLCSNNGNILRAAALAGEGITELPTFLVGCDIAEGRLLVLLEDNPRDAFGIYALYTPNRYLAAKTRVLIDFLAARFGADPEWERFDRQSRSLRA